MKSEKVYTVNSDNRRLPARSRERLSLEPCGDGPAEELQ